MPSAASNIEACKSTKEVISAANRVIAIALNDSPALRRLGGPASIEADEDISKWVSKLKEAAGSAAADLIVFPSVYASLRAAIRKLQAMEDSSAQP